MRNLIASITGRLRPGLVCIYVLLGLLLFSGSALEAQVIVETFETPSWSTIPATSSASGTVGVNVTSTAVSQVITSYSANSSGSATVTTHAPASTGSWNWAYSKASIFTAANSQLRKHSAQTSVALISSTSYLITPIITSGVATVTFWASASSTNKDLYVGMKTNLTGALTAYPTTAGTSTSGTAASTAAGNAYAQFSGNSSSFTGINPTASSYSYSYSFTGPAQMAFINNSGSGVYIDDIVITSPLPAGASKLAVTPTPSGVISGNTFSVTVEAQNVSNNATNVIANTDFTLSVATGSGTLGGTVSGTILAGSSSATVNVNYTMAAGETGVSFAATRTAGDVLTAGTSGIFNVIAAVPSTSSTISFGATTGTSITANFTGGNGARRVVVVKPGNGGTTFIPTVGAGLTGTISNDFLVATDQGSGDKLVYDGTGTTVTVNDLNPGASYAFTVFEYNGSALTSNYRTTAPGTGVQATAAAPAIIAGSVTTFGDQVAGSTSTEKSYSVSGAFLTGNITITPPAGFEISTGTGAGFVPTNPIILVQSAGIVSATSIYVRFVPSAVQAYSGSISHTSAGAAIETVAVSGNGLTPSAVTALAIPQRSDNIMRLTWTAPVGNYDGVLVFARPLANVNYTPTGAGASFMNANANIAAAGVYNTDNYLVYSGTGTSVEVTGLSNNTAYYFQVFTYSASTYSPAASVNSTTALADVTGFAASLANNSTSLSWTNPLFFGTQSNYWDEVMIVGHSGSAVTAVPAGNGAGYTADLAFGNGTDLGSANFVLYKGANSPQVVTGLTNGVQYHFTAFVRHGSVWTAGVSTSVTPGITFAVGDYGSVASGTWTAAFATTWKKWDGTGWNTTATSAPTATDNVWIVNGVTVTLAAAGTCNTLHVVNGILKSGTNVNSIQTLTIAGTMVEVTSGGVVGNGLDDDLADGISFQFNNTGASSISGIGGVIDLSKLIINGVGSSLAIDHDITVRYHGSANAGNASGLYPLVNNTTLNVNAGRTLTMAKWSSIYSTTSSHATPALNFAMNINGTVTFEPGRPTGNTATYGWAGSGTAGNGYLSLNAGAVNVVTLAVGATGTVNVPEFYPNSTLANGNAGTGSVSTITVATGGVINIDSVADFRNAAQTITGGGTVNIRPGTLVKIGSASGITAASASGPIQTTTRGYNVGATYSYEGTVAQVTGDGLPANANGVVIKNITGGVTLTNNVVTNLLTLTNGVIDLGSTNITAAAVAGGSATSYVKTSSTGYLKMPVGSTNVVFPVGRSTYNPATLNNSGTADNFSVIVNDDILTGGTSGPTVTVGAVQRTWLVEEEAVGGSNVAMTVQWNNTSEINGFDQNHVFLVHHNGTIWENYLGSTLPSNAPAATSLGSGNFSVTQTGLSTFSPFGVHSGSTPLAIYVTDIAATNNGTVNNISWSTATEDAGDRIELERSADAKSFDNIATIQGQGSNSRYNYEDTKPAVGVNYYRLKLVDKAGAAAYSKVVSATVKGAGVTVNVYPNPVNDVLNISLSNDEEFSLTLTDLSGRTIKQVNASGNNASIDMSKLQKGIYLLKYSNGSQVELFKVVK